MHIELDNITHPQVIDLLTEHLNNMFELSPPEQVFALDMSKLQRPEITFWTVWEEGVLLGCGALKALSATEGEIKSMRTPRALRRRGAGRMLLAHIIETARQRGYRTLSLETGTHPEFGKAHRLYESAGFTLCGPFADYKEDPHSVFMQLHIAPDAGALARGHRGAS